MTPRRRIHGVSAIETLLALPVLLLVGGGALQFGLVYHAKHALNHALIEAARAGSVAHADQAAIRQGLARGLVPWLYGAADLGDYAVGLARATVHVAQAEALGGLRLERVSPSDASFADWAEPARDAAGEPLPGLREIPNDDLVHRARRTPPGGAVAGARHGEPIGAASGQTLADANMLRLRLDYGVPLSVPVVGRILAWSMRAWHGCGSVAPLRLGTVELGSPPGPGGPAWACAMLGVGGAADRPRLPVTLSATLRMQSPAREPAGARAPDAGGQPFTSVARIEGVTVANQKRVAPAVSKVARCDSGREGTPGEVDRTACSRESPVRTGTRHIRARVQARSNVGQRRRSRCERARRGGGRPGRPERRVRSRGVER